MPPRPGGEGGSNDWRLRSKKAGGEKNGHNDKDDDRKAMEKDERVLAYAREIGGNQLSPLAFPFHNRYTNIEISLLIRR